MVNNCQGEDCIYWIKNMYHKAKNEEDKTKQQ